MPFIQELGSGSLARDKFQFYIAQDSLYLENFGRAFALIGSRETVEIGMAATLPCFWIYKKIGDHIFGNREAGDNLYQPWINTCGGDEFATAVQRATLSVIKRQKNHLRYQG